MRGLESSASAISICAVLVVGGVVARGERVVAASGAA